MTIRRGHQDERKRYEEKKIMKEKVREKYE